LQEVRLDVRRRAMLTMNKIAFTILAIYYFYHSQDVAGVLCLLGVNLDEVVVCLKGMKNEK